MNTNDPPTSPSITMQPTNQSVTVGQTATFTVTASGASPLAYQWHKNGASIPGATSATYVTPSTTTGDNGSSFNVAVSNSLGSVTSSFATLTVNSMPAPTTDVLTYHYDNMRTGQNLNETILTPANVNTAKFGKLGEFTVDGKVDGQPLYLTNVSIPNKGTKNVLYVVTEHGSVFAFDADSASGSTSSFLWMTSTLQPGETPSDNHNCNQVTPEIGITSTPVIDRARGAIYVIALSKNAMGNYIFRIHALDLTTGKERFGGPFAISATFTGSGATVSFDPAQYNERPGLLEVNGTIYTTWGSHCDSAPYTSWIMSFSADTLAQTGVLNLEPNGSEGGIWMSGTAPAADSSGNIYFIVGNGTFDTSLTAGGFPSKGDCGNCFAKISSATPLQLLDYFTPLNTVSESAADVDFGSGGPLLLPDIIDSTGKTRHLAIGAGKDTNIYIVDRDNMGKFNATQDNIYQLITGQLASRVDSKPSYFNGTVYYCAVGDFLKAFPIVNGQLAAPSSRTANMFQFPGATPTISASNSTTNGIVWAVENGTNLPAVLHAYDATNLATEFYNSNQAANGRDHFSGNKFITPLVVNGKVYVGTPSSVAVFGLLP
jgi:Immunoglobulin domain